MEDIKHVAMIILKIFLILTGSMMLLGGGICVATNVAFIIPNLGHGDVSLFLVLMSISALVAAVGWGILVLSGVTKYAKPAKNAAPEKTDDSDKNND